jgi:hypothetical protein
MAHESISRNPFMLMTHPEVVVAAMERSERLSQLNRHLCRPLDRHMPAAPGAANAETSPADESGDDADDGV